MKFKQEFLAEAKAKEKQVIINLGQFDNKYTLVLGQRLKSSKASINVNMVNNSGKRMSQSFRNITFKGSNHPASLDYEFYKEFIFDKDSLKTIKTAMNDVFANAYDTPIITNYKKGKSYSIVLGEYTIDVTNNKAETKPIRYANLFSGVNKTSGQANSLNNLQLVGNGGYAGSNHENDLKELLDLSDSKMKKELMEYLNTGLYKVQDIKIIK